MKSRLHLLLRTSQDQHDRLVALQHAFAEVCNALAPIAQQTGCWNRVALHHMAYKAMRQRFPGIGSQMICNAVYSVSRACRMVYQHPASPFNLQRLAGRPLPRVQFLPQSPVYFDRHTLSLKDGQVSLFTLDGRMRFNLALNPLDEQRFRTEKLCEIVLSEQGGQFSLQFLLDDGELGPGQTSDANPKSAASESELPEYMLVIDGPGAPASPSLPPSAAPFPQNPS